MSQTTPLAYTELPAEPLRPPEPIPERYHAFVAPLVFAALTFLMFFDILFSTHWVISSASTDLSMQFVAWREFGFGQLSHGHLPLWNPHVYGGTPYFAGFQSALLYPPNWLHLFLPVTVAINWITALHVFLAGYFTYLWCRGRHLTITASILAGVMFMFCGEYFLHIYSGHLPHLAIMVWAPLMLLTLDKLAETGNPNWCFLGIVATAMEILAGHPQYVYYTGMVLGLYMLLQMIWSKHRLMLGIGFIVMYAGAVLLTAMQLLPGIQAAGEQVRSGGLSYVTAGSFSLPPQNLITLLAPTFFGQLTTDGDVLGVSYWGGGYLWELSLYISVTGLVLAVLGAIGVIRNQWRTAVILLGVVLITLTLGLGRHVPFIYYPLFKYLPVYGSFRGTVKFTYLMTLFLALLAGMGFDDILRNRRVSWLFIYPVLIVALGLTTLGGVVSGTADGGPKGAWGKYVISMIVDEARLESISLEG